jgi:hypothetical protein
MRVLDKKYLENYLGLEKDGFENYNIPIPEVFSSMSMTILICLWSGYIWIREGKPGGATRDDQLVCVWNRDITRFYYVEQLEALYFGLAGRELKPFKDINKVKLTIKTPKL